MNITSFCSYGTIMGVATELLALAVASLAISQERKSFKKNHTSVLIIIRTNAQNFPQFNA